MLLRQDLRGGHHGGLDPVFRGQPGSRRGHHGLAAAHVALDQPVHHAAAPQVSHDLGHGPFLGVGQLVGQSLQEGRQIQLLPGLPAFLGPAAAQQGKTHGEDKEFLKHQPVPGPVQGLEGFRHVDIAVGCDRVAEPVPGPEFSGQQLRQLLQAGLQGLLHRTAHQAVAHPRCQRVDGHDAAGQDPGLLHRLKDRIGDLVAHVVPVQRAVEIVFPAVFQVLRHIGLVEEGQIQPGRIVGHGELGEIQALADVVGPGIRGHKGPEAGRLVHLQLRDGHDPAPVLIGSGEIGNQIIQGRDPHGRKELGAGLAHSLEIPDGFKQLCHGATSNQA